MKWANRYKVLELGIYRPMEYEPNLEPVYHALQERGVQLYMPIISVKSAPLSFIPVQVKAQEYVKLDKALYSTPPNLIIPCLGFNDNNYRIGWGGGYYDRTLALQPNGCRTVGVSYEALRIDFKPEAHDVPLEQIITED